MVNNILGYLQLWWKRRNTRRAAEQGNAEAQNNLGVAYYWGHGVAEDESEAVKWWRKSAEQRYARAQYNLGNAYRTGEGVAKDQAEGVKWYREAAMQGDAKAQYDLGVAYRKGEGVAKDMVEGYAWISLGAGKFSDRAEFQAELKKSMTAQQVTAGLKRVMALGALIEASHRWSKEFKEFKEFHRVQPS